MVPVRNNKMIWKQRPGKTGCLGFRDEEHPAHLLLDWRANKIS
jgi:hypothetical protein